VLPGSEEISTRAQKRVIGLRPFLASCVYMSERAYRKPEKNARSGDNKMKNDSDVQFATDRRIHVAMGVRNLSQSVAFYRVLFGQEPTKTRPGYAKFEVAEPPVNLSLNEIRGPTNPSNSVAHFGIQVKSSAIVQELGIMLANAGLATKTEAEVTCCYAVQSKVWITDPDGNKWEIFVVLDNDGAHHKSSANECCAPGTSECCVPVANGCCTEAAG
jgi:catechol 2,3-dioxygenase-like lactoylglutathione lyase family enzyme